MSTKIQFDQIKVGDRFKLTGHGMMYSYVLYEVSKIDGDVLCYWDLREAKSKPEYRMTCVMGRIAYEAIVARDGIIWGDTTMTLGERKRAIKSAGSSQPVKN
jgi:hypothetical protein